MKSLKDDFKNADIVVFAEVLSIEPDSLEKGYRPYTLKAKVKESFKGPFVEGESIIYSEVREVYDDEPHESHSLGDRILWLRKWNDKGNDRYGNIEFMWGGIDCDILEKLRKISKGK